jgi:hypothetical protein
MDAGQERGRAVVVVCGNKARPRFFVKEKEERVKRGWCKNHGPAMLKEEEEREIER